MRKIVSIFSAIVFLCGIFLNFSAFMVFADNDLSADRSLEEIEKGIEYDLIPDYLLTDTQRHITREEFTSVIVNLYEKITTISVEIPADNPFIDTNNSDVLKAYQLGLVHGVGQMKFNPKETLTLEEKATMLYNTLQKLDPKIDEDVEHDPNFADEEQISNWAIEAINYLATHSIITVDINNNINPQDSISIQEARITVSNAAEHHLDNMDNEKAETTLERSFDPLGMVAGDTMIEMDDGTLKRMDKVKTREHIRTLNGNSAQIIDVVTGTETIVYKLTTKSGRYINGSKSLPIVTENGVDTTGHLVIGNKILTVDGVDEIEDIELINYNDAVYSIIVDGDTTYYGNGIALLESISR